MSSQDNLDAAAAAFLEAFTAHQQQQSAAAPAPPTPVQAEPTPTTATLQQSLFAAQQQQQPAPQPQPQAQVFPGLDPNMARLFTDLLNGAKQQQQYTSAPLTQPTLHFGASGSPMVSKSPPTAVTQPQSLLASAQLLGTLNPSLAAALMSNALQQSASAGAVPILPYSSAQGVKSSDNSSSELIGGPRTITTVPTTTTSTASLPPFAGPALGGADPIQQQQQKQQRPPPPPTYPITKMQKWTLEQLGKFCCFHIIYFHC